METTMHSSPPSFSNPCDVASATVHGGSDHQNGSVPLTSHKRSRNVRYMIILVINYVLLFVGSVSSSLLAKFYFIHKGSSRWVSAWIQCAGFPILLVPIFLPYLLNFSTRKPFTDMTPKLFTFSVIVGLFIGVNNLLFSWGTSYLPVSTSSLVLSTQLAFTLIMSFIIVKQAIAFNNLNCVVLLTVSSVLLALGSSHDRPEGLTKAKYFIGFACTLSAGLLFSLYLPTMEKVYRMIRCYEMVMEMQLVMEMAATVLATVGMVIEGGVAEMRREANHVFDMGPAWYYGTLVMNIVSWQCCFMGTAGMVFLTTSVTGGVCVTALTVANVVGGVVVYHDRFGNEKVVATVLCTWGFCSYVYGMYVKMKKGEEKLKSRDEMEMMTQRGIGNC
ncbi:hypothetical protein Droror1_Dr00003542 [Drosera rotundifolia]